MLDPELKFEITYETTNSYGRTIHTSPVSRIDREFLKKLCTHLKALQHNVGNGFTYKSEDQLTFLTFVEEALLAITPAAGKCNIFSDNKDHMKRPIRRYVMEGQDYRYLIDAFSELDVSLVLSKARRFWLTHIPRMFAKVDNSKFQPKIRYLIRIWNTPVSYYQIEFVTANMPVEYSSRIEKMRQMVGYPDFYELKEKGLYERIDYDIRRALFHEGSDVFKK